MKFLEVLTPPPNIYHCCSICNNFLEEKFTPVNMASCVRRNVRKHRETNNGDQYILVEISSNIYCLENREFISSESRDYMVRPGEGLNTSLDLRTKSPNKKQKTRFSITDINNQDFRNFPKEFKNLSYLGYNSKPVHNEPTEA